MASARESELTLINFIIKEVSIFKENESNLKSFPFEYPYSKDIYSIVTPAIKKHGQAPTLIEAKRLGEKLSDKRNHTSIQRGKLQDDLEYTYLTASTSSSGDVFAEYIFKQGAKELANKLLVSTPEDFKKHYSELKDKLDSLSSIEAKEESMGVSLMSTEHITECMTLIESANNQECIATGWKAWDRHLLGGFRPGEVAMIMGATGQGKSAVLLNMAYNNAVDMNKRVVYITMDNQVEECAERFFARWLRKPINNIHKYEEMHEELLSRVKPGSEHNFVLQTWLPQRHNPQHIANYLNKLKEKLKIYDYDHGVPIDQCGHIDLLMIDYLEKLLPVHKQEMYRQDLFQIADECVVLAKSFGFPVILASQSNKEALKSETSQIHQSGESYAKLHPCAHVIIISMSDDERLSAPSRMKLVNGKNRRPETSYAVPMIFDRYQQFIYEDPDRPIIALNSTLRTDASASQHGVDRAQAVADGAAEVARMYNNRSAMTDGNEVEVERVSLVS